MKDRYVTIPIFQLILERKMKKDLPIPVVAGIIIVVLIIIGIVYWAVGRPKASDPTAVGLPPTKIDINDPNALVGRPSPGEVHQPPAGWSFEGNKPQTTENQQQD